MDNLDNIPFIFVLPNKCHFLCPCVLSIMKESVHWVPRHARHCAVCWGMMMKRLKQGKFLDGLVAQTLSSQCRGGALD